jgi:hypothetical protein
MVYVISREGRPLMPTKRYAKVRVLLKQKRAKVVMSKPFTIQLLYETTAYTQPIVAGYDPGRTHQSITAVKEETGEVQISSELISRNKEVPKLMAKRKMHRMIRRRNRRMRKIRHAKRCGATFEVTKYIYQPGADKPIPVKYIKCKEARFCNRKRPEGWLTPTANHLLQTHINYLKKIRKILPITRVVLEYAKFDIQKLENPDIKGEGYQGGRLYGYANTREYIEERQNHKCLLCGKNPIEHLHHIKPRHESGSDSCRNKAGFCNKCHIKVHKNEKVREKLAEKLEGLSKQYDSTNILNSIMPYLYKEIQKIMGAKNVQICYGYETKIMRKSLGLGKTHYNDSYAMALMAAKQTSKIQDITPYMFKQYRRHNRQFCDAERDRLYKKGREIAARNRKKKMEQKNPSLEDYREELITSIGKKEAARVISGLTVYKAIKRIRTSIKEIPMPQGSIVMYKGKRMVVMGVLNKGNLLVLENHEGYVPVKECKLLARNSGIVCL